MAVIPGLSGSLLSHEVIDRLLDGGGDVVLEGDLTPRARRALRVWHAGIRDLLGPACGPRRVYDLVAEPLFHSLGFTVLPVGTGADRLDAVLLANNRPAAALTVSAWGEPARAVWRHAIRLGLAHDVRWCLCVNGRAVRLFDAHRAYARRAAEFDLTLAVDDERACSALCGLLQPSALAGESGRTALDRVVQLCEHHRSDVRTSLREGVHHSLLCLVGAFREASRRRADPSLLDESLIVIYRVLFLLFAEARGLVPRWHPVYRDSYAIETLATDIHAAAGPTGIWEALQAIARLAHRGCRAGALRVTAFNGRLFSPSDAPLSDRLLLNDRAVADALLSLTTRKGPRGREPISYADLGVEQLGAVYEQVLDFGLTSDQHGGKVTLVPTGRRKATGSFYTPRSLTDFLIRRTLAPVVQDASPDDILRLRVLDPSMGSGAFLVAACRYLAAAYEQALVREGSLSAADIDDGDRAEFRRAVAQRCLFGVDVNPMAVQLGRLSLWLATLAAEKPLTFLDHHLRSGNSLLGATAEALGRSPVRGRARLRELPLFPHDLLQGAMEAAIAARVAIAGTPDDSAEQVRGKERALASLNAPGGPVERWKTAADLWCTAWQAGPGERLTPAVFRALLDRVLRNADGLPAHVAGPILARAKALAAGQRFFHWPFEFPEVFYDDRGAPLARPGFDAVVGNPPWEMLRGDPGAADTATLARFSRRSGVYALQGNGHGNLYQLFLERAFQLLRPGGRCGLILPSGIATDESCALLRRHLFARTSIDTFTTLENREGIFPIHRGLKFLLMTLTHGDSTAQLPVRPGLRSASELDAVPDAGPQPGGIRVPRLLIERMSGDGLAIPEFRTPQDLAICSSIVFRVPALGDPAGWHVRFGRELNATDDRPHFTAGGPGLPVVEGKQLQPFVVETDASKLRLPQRVAARLLSADDTFERPRLGYREVASATNRLTLIAAIVPAGVVTTHTVFCLKDRLADTAQQYLCGVFNSYVANYLVRMRLGTHVTAALLARLPVPRPAGDDPCYLEVAAASRALAGGGDERRLARLNAVVAGLYGLTRSEFAHVLDTFPLISPSARALPLAMFPPAEEPGR